MLDQKKIWQSFNALHSSDTTQQFLLRCYQDLNVDDADKKAFGNCYPFIYYLEHGQNYYQLANQATLSIKPVLLFYGMVQLLKACLLTVDPQYPESTSVLAHGVSTRKRKKQSYEFFQDEVKIQKNGLFTHFSERMFNVKYLEGEKYTMETLLKKLPEMNNLFSLHYHSEVSTKIADHNHNFMFPLEMTDKFHMTARRFEDFIIDSIPAKLIPDNSSKETKNIILQQPNGGTAISPLSCSPILFHLYENSYYFPNEREQVTHFPEVMVHYLLLYNLSMISRYETEWWSELLHSYSSNDYPFIQQFLSLTSDKVPFLIYLFLEEKIGMKF
ncbi:YaaC family protein [Litchfieldia salsa]|uniref:YaaC-like Protein n=1 Tax=Litchfieldia salsa TaxID=930152 RepID=A0A1H0X271_9BACI|nr:YaaC family protein [Litchfieldia salsa]SDP97057.1 YaaC-like Protein [Litchfieldia salsa]